MGFLKIGFRITALSMQICFIAAYYTVINIPRQGRCFKTPTRVLQHCCTTGALQHLHVILPYHKLCLQPSCVPFLNHFRHKRAKEWGKCHQWKGENLSYSLPFLRTFPQYLLPKCLNSCHSSHSCSCRTCSSLLVSYTCPSWFFLQWHVGPIECACCGLFFLGTVFSSNLLLTQTKNELCSRQQCREAQTVYVGGRTRTYRSLTTVENRWILAGNTGLTCSYCGGP